MITVPIDIMKVLEAAALEPAVEFFGLVFNKMDNDDYMAFSGAEEGSYICYNGEQIFIWSPSQKIMSEIWPDAVNDCQWHQRDWSLARVLG